MDRFPLSAIAFMISLTNCQIMQGDKGSTTTSPNFTICRMSRNYCSSDNVSTGHGGCHSYPWISPKSTMVSSVPRAIVNLIPTLDLGSTLTTSAEIRDPSQGR